MSDLSAEQDQALQQSLERYRVSEWISVEDRLPDHPDEEVLIYTPRWGVLGGHNYNADGSPDGDWPDMWTNDEGLPQGGVTHWMPLPEPPQEQKQ